MTHEFDFGTRAPSWEQPAPPSWRPVRQPAPTREELLQDYARKPVRRFYQVDGWEDPYGDDVLPPDEDGHVLAGFEVHELRTSDFPIRVYINQDSNPATVAALLRKVIEFVESDWRTISGADYVDAPAPAAPTRTGNVIEVDFSRVAARGPYGVTSLDMAAGETWNGTPIDQAPPWELPEDQRPRYDDGDLPF